MSLRIGLVISSSFSQHGGVIEHVKSLAQELTRLGVTPLLISPSTETSLGPHLQIGHTIRFPSPNGSWANLSLTAQSIHSLRQVLVRQKLDLLHFHELTYPAASWQILAASSIPNIATFHTGWNTKDANPLFTQSYSWLAKNVIKDRLQGTIHVSQISALCNSLLSPSNSVLLPPIVNTPQYNSPSECPKEILPNKLNLLFIGRFEKRKGLPYLLKALNSLDPAKRAQIHLNIIGSGPQQPWIALYRPHLNFSVNFLGAFGGRKKIAYLKHSDIFLAPTTHGESFGMILVEAMAAGLPIIAGNNDGYLETLAKYLDKSLIVDPTNTRLFASAINKLITDPPLRKTLSQWGLAESRKYSPSQIARQHLAFYKKTLTLAGRTPPRPPPSDFAIN